MPIKSAVFEIFPWCFLSWFVRYSFSKCSLASFRGDWNDCSKIFILSWILDEGFKISSITWFNFSSSFFFLSYFLLFSCSNFCFGLFLFLQSLGYSGKSVIHPDQISMVHKSFYPNKTEISWAKKVLNII